jgi:hypothetical protein
MQFGPSHHSQLPEIAAALYSCIAGLTCCMELKYHPCNLPLATHISSCPEVLQRCISALLASPAGCVGVHQHLA